MAARDKHDQEMLAVWTRIADALERIAANMTGNVAPQHQHPLRPDPMTINAPVLQPSTQEVIDK
jgi:hypothetical protein